MTVKFNIATNILKKKEMMHRKPDEILGDIEQAHNAESAFQVDTDSMTISANQMTALSSANHNANFNTEINQTTETMQTIQSAKTETINTFQTSTADSTEFFQSSYYYIIEVRISLK